MKKFKRKRRIICPTCKTGMESYSVDNSSPVCPYISCYNGFRCPYYVPVDDVEDRGILTEFIRNIRKLFKP